MTKHFREDIETFAYTALALLAGFFMTKAQKRKFAAPRQAPRSAFTAVYHDLIPGWANMRQQCPVRKPLPKDSLATHRILCDFNRQEIWRGREPFLQATIIHLNDYHEWSREDIAAWLETLDHDLTFKTPEEVNR